MANSIGVQGTFIPINGGQSPQAALALSFGQAMQRVISLGTLLIGILNDMIGQSGPSQFTAIETMFGIPTGSGQTFFNIINGSMGAINGTMENSQCVNAAQQIG